MPYLHHSCACEKGDDAWAWLQRLSMPGRALLKAVPLGPPTCSMAWVGSELSHILDLSTPEKAQHAGGYWGNHIIAALCDRFSFARTRQATHTPLGQSCICVVVR